jgi:hypothetical protein
MSSMFNTHTGFPVFAGLAALATALDALVLTLSTTAIEVLIVEKDDFVGEDFVEDGAE